LTPNHKPHNYAQIILLAWMIAMFVFLFLPIGAIIVYSFNGGRNLYVWTEWSTRWYGAIFDNPRATDALWVSLQTAFINAIMAVTLGVLAGIALARRKGQ